MLCRMAFSLSGKMVALHLNNSTAKAYLCNQSGTVPPFLSWQACHILNLADKHGIILIPAYITTNLNAEAGHVLCRSLVPEWLLLPCIAHGSITLGQSEVDCWHPHIPVNVSIIHHGESAFSGNLAVESFQPSLDISDELNISSSCSSSLVPLKFLAEHVTGEFRVLIFIAPGWIKAPWLPTVLNMLDNIPH